MTFTELTPLLTACLLIIATAALSWFAVGRLISYLISRDIVDRPNERSLHEKVIPRGGGLVIVAGLVFSLSALSVFSNRPQLFSCLTLLVVFWASLSWWDDKHDLSARFRLFIQFLICIITVSALGWVTTVFSVNLMWLGSILSVIGLLWMANLYNFMDGLDGFAASQTIVGSITLAFWFYRMGDNELSLVCIILAALSYGFLLWNWSPAKIFLGDVGSISLGGFFGVLFILGTSRYGLSIVSFFSLFGVFIADSTITILIRCWRREKIWQPHKQHFYQRLASVGYSHSSIAVGGLILMLICSLFATLGVIDHDMIAYSLAATIALLTITIGLVIYLESRAKT